MLDLTSHGIGFTAAMSKAAPAVSRNCAPSTQARWNRKSREMHEPQHHSILNIFGGPGAERHCQAGCGVCPCQGCKRLWLVARAVLESVKLHYVPRHWHPYQQPQHQQDHPCQHSNIIHVAVVIMRTAAKTTPTAETATTTSTSNQQRNPNNPQKATNHAQETTINNSNQPTTSNTQKQ